MQRCEPSKVEIFDYSQLSPAFARLSKPAKRALINNRIFTVKDLARQTRSEVTKFHGIGPSAFPVLIAALKAEGLDFKSELKAT